LDHNVVYLLEVYNRQNNLHRIAVWLAILLPDENQDKISSIVRFNIKCIYVCKKNIKKSILTSKLLMTDLFSFSDDILDVSRWVV